MSGAGSMDKEDLRVRIYPDPYDRSSDPGRGQNNFRLKGILDLALLSSILLFFLRIIPADVFNELPATGGDTGSHFWPLKVLVEHSLPNWSIRAWNPGNLAGEPHFLHYFPFPFLVMALLSLFMPLGTAFNIGTILPVVIFPFSAYLFGRLSRLPWPVSPLMALGALYSVLNPGFSMWGGNLLSTLAGQFAHMYALNLLLLGLGVTIHELHQKRPPLLSALIFSCLVISHSYVMLGLPFFALSFLALKLEKRLVIKHWLICGVLTLLLSLWFLIPMLDNSQWTTPFSMKWISENIFREAFPKVLDPVLWALGAGALICLLLSRSLLLRQLLFWLIPSLAYAAFYLVFPHLGLVDVRALPQISLFVCLLGSILLGEALRRISPRLLVVILPLIFGAALMHLRDLQREPVAWMKWNYSGWQSKKLYPELMELAKTLKGDLSQGRVAYEHSDLSRAAGTERVFEMLPYFAGRATLESVYLQANILALPIFYLQSEISKTPSCPFPELKCSAPDLERARHHLNLLGVTELILISDELREQANRQSWLKLTGVYGPWYLYENLDQPSLVEVGSFGSLNPDSFSSADSLDWFLKFNGASPAPNLVDEIQNNAGSLNPGLTNCHPSVRVDFSGITLLTDCPGRQHLMKFAYHSYWKSSVPLQMLRPGFIGLVPQEAETRLAFETGSTIILRNFLSGQQWFSKF
jgi:hypothetical protein